jgi:hypothetical protein
VQVITRTAAMDALFALAGTQAASVVTEPAGPGFQPPTLPEHPGIEVEWAVRETTRRLANAGRWRADLGLAPHTRPRPAARPPRIPTSTAHSALLAHVNGRRTCRDLAFTIGRGLYPVMTDLALLVGDGWIVVPPPQEQPPAADAVSQGPDKPGPRPYGDRARTGRTMADHDILGARRYSVTVDSVLPRREIRHHGPNSASSPRPR